MITKYIFIYFSFLTIFKCSTTQYSYSPTAVYSENDSRQITDEDIKKAFDAVPQIIVPAKVSLYNLSDDSLVENMNELKNNASITEIYIIPKSLIEGVEESDHHYYRREKKSIDIKTLRLFAARAKNDLLILVSSKFDAKTSTNAWGIFYITLIGGLFVPATDVVFEYTTECFIFDVRNGYMYKHLKISSEKEEIKYIFPLSVQSESELAKNRLIKKVAPHLIAEIHNFLKSP